MDPLPLNQVIQGDCVEVLQGFPENSIDLVVTDPPYGLSFIDKDGDSCLKCSKCGAVRYNQGLGVL